MKTCILAVLLGIFSFNACAEKMIDFNLPVYQKNEKFQLSDKLKGKKILINFWASWCTSCIHEIPQLEALKVKYGNDVQFVAVNAGEKSNLIDRFLKKYKFTFVILNDDDRNYSKSIGVNSLPVTIVVDKDMNIIYRDIVPPKEL
ncbi:MAG: TlpA family protein disulfide reductase [Alphaproteobacteria bacterium]|nr:MAG: TlpA family protein disulfide reductase [Alphaproteobacteria bacterium]